MKKSSKLYAREKLFGFEARLLLAAAILLLATFTQDALAQAITKFTNKKSGRVVFIKVQNDTAGTAASRPRGARIVPTPDPTKVSAGIIAAAQLAVGASALQLERIEKDFFGMTHLRYSQRYRGIRVYGADAMVHLDKVNQGSSAGVNISEAPRLRSYAKVGSVKAVAIAKQYWKAEFGRKSLPASMNVTRYVLDTSLINNVSADVGDKELVWAVRLLSEAPGRSWIYFISAKDGSLKLKESLESGIERKVADCTYQNASGACALAKDNPDDGVEYTYGRIETTPPNGPNPYFLPEISTDNDDVFELMGKVHHYVETAFGLNGANRVGGLGPGSVILNGQPLTATKAQTYTDFAQNSQCPAANFTWTGAIVLCQGTVVPDIIAHEYAHGIQYYSHYEVQTPVGMVYFRESGALMENHSDAFGEAFEKFLTGENDWISADTSVMPHKRNFANPPNSRGNSGNQLTPDHYYAGDFYCGSDDGLFKYSNMQILNKAFYLVSTGGWFNGCSLGTGIGIEKAIQIWTRAVTHYYSRSETFNGAFYKLQRSCADLYDGETSVECVTLQRALQSVGLDQAGRCSGISETIPACVDVLS